jgi:hypothetical protein
MQRYKLFLKYQRIVHKISFKMFRPVRFFARQSGRAERFAETSAKRLSTCGAQKAAEPSTPEIARFQSKYTGSARTLHVARCIKDFENKRWPVNINKKDFG